MINGDPGPPAGDKNRPVRTTAYPRDPASTEGDGRPCIYCGKVHSGFAANLVAQKGPTMCEALADARIRYDRAIARHNRKQARHSRWLGFKTWCWLTLHGWWPR